MIDRICEKLNDMGFICTYGDFGGPVYSYKEVTRDIKFCIILLYNRQNHTVILQDYWVEAYRRYRKMEDVTDLSDALTSFLRNIDELEKLLEDQ